MLVHRRVTLSIKSPPLNSPAWVEKGTVWTQDMSPRLIVNQKLVSGPLMNKKRDLAEVMSSKLNPAIW